MTRLEALKCIDNPDDMAKVVFALFKWAEIQKYHQDYTGDVVPVEDKQLIAEIRKLLIGDTEQDMSVFDYSKFGESYFSES